MHFGATGTAALTTDGELVWRARFPYISQHGNGGSPILHDGRLILSIDGYDTAFLVAVDAETGEERWRNTRPDPVSQAYSTPLTIRVGDREQIVGVSAFRTTGHDPATGEEIWRVRYPNGFSNVPRPVHGHGMVYVSTGFQTPVLLAVRTDGSGDVTRSHIAWRLRRGAPLTPSPILVGDELYVVTDFGIATCVDAHTGDIHWQERLGGNHSASPVFVDGRIYFQNEEGITTVIAPGTEFRELARNRLDGVTLASMAVSDAALFVRTDTPPLPHRGAVSESRQPADHIPPSGVPPRTHPDRPLDDPTAALRSTFGAAPEAVAPDRRECAERDRRLAARGAYSSGRR